MTQDEHRPTLSVVVPVYNERDTVERLIELVRAVDVDKEIVVVVDGSTDGTRDILADLQARAREGVGGADLRVFLQDRNRGKGAALRRGFREALGTIVIVQDADLEYDPQDYHKLLAPILQGHADVVYGSRFLGDSHRVLYYWHSVGNKLLTVVSNVFTNLNLSDVWTCYKAFRAEVLQGIELREDGFGFEPEVTAKVARGDWRVYEVGISYWGRTYEEGKKIRWHDALGGLWSILRYNLLSRR